MRKHYSTPIVAILFLLFSLSSHGYLDQVRTGNKSNPVVSQDPNTLSSTFGFEVYGEEEGLEQLVITGIVRDHLGYLWVGTQNGLYRFDGYNFSKYTSSTNTLGNTNNHFIKSLALQKDFLWIATNTGLFRLNLQTRFYEWIMLSEEGPFNITDLIITDNNELLVSAANYLFRVSETDSLKPSITLITQIPDNENILATWQVDSKIFIEVNNATYQVENLNNNAGLKKFTTFSTSQTGRLKIRSLLAVNNTLYIGTLDNGVWQYNQHGLKFLGFKNFIEITNLAVFNNEIWIGGRVGLGYFDIAQQSLHSIPYQPQTLNGFKGRGANSLFTDFRGIWVGANGIGLNHISRVESPFDVITVNNNADFSLPHPSVFSILEYGNRIWVGTAHGLSMLDLRNHNSINLNNENRDHPIPLNQINSMIGLGDGLGDELDDGLLVSSMTEHLVKINPNTFEYEVYKPGDESGLQGASIVCMVKHPNKNLIYLCSRDVGIEVYDPLSKRFSQLTNSNDQPISLPSRKIQTIFFDSKDQLWVGTLDSGLFKIVNGQVQQTPLKEYGIQSVGNIILDFHEDTQQEALWIASWNGIIKINIADRSHKLLNNTNGLPNNNVYQVIDNGNGGIWASTNYGLVEVSSTDNILHYNKSQGLPSNEFNSNAALRAIDQTLYFGTNQGLVYFNEDDLGIDREAEGVVITALSLLNQKAYPNQHENIPVDISYLNEIALEYDETIFSIQFSSLKSNRPDQLRYQYRLIGLDDNWISLGTRSRSASFTNLASGDYTFEVRAHYGTGNFGPTKRLKINIEPAPWLSTTAKTIYASLAILVIYLYLYSRAVKQRRLIVMNQTLEKRVAERTEALSKSNQDLNKTVKDLKEAQQQLVEQEKMAALGSMVSGVAHEINTPIGTCLTSTTHLTEEVNKLVEKKQNQTLTATDFDESLGHIQMGLDIVTRNIQRAAALVKSFKKVSVNQSYEDVIQFDLNELITDCILTTRPVWHSHNHSIEVECAEFQLRTYFGMLSQVIINLITNSVNHGFEGLEEQKITIRVTDKGKQIRIDYLDSGKGIDESIRKHIFEPFTTTGRVKGNTGLGMHIVYNIVHQSLQGTIRLLKSKKGAHFVVRIPKDISDNVD